MPKKATLEEILKTLDTLARSTAEGFANMATKEDIAKIFNKRLTKVEDKVGV